jgi:aldehyde dehydrogenase (NAD+)
VSTLRRHDHWIDGRWSAPADGGSLPATDPTTRRVTALVAAGGAADVERAVVNADRARREWASRAAGDRSDVLHAIGRAIETHGHELVELERSSTGKVPEQARSEVATSAAYFRYYAGALHGFGGRVIEQGARHHTYTRFEPYGVVAVITPWNLPLNQASRAVAPAIAVGNSVVVKPSEFTSTSTLRLAELACEAGLPAGIFNVVTGTGPDAGAPLAGHALVRRIAFTGSAPTGRRLAALGAERLVPLTLELGGKSPLVVFADADLDRAVDAAVRAATVNAGQVCSATTRVLVEAEAHDEVAARIVAAVARLRPGVDFGPLITQAQYEKVLAAFDDAQRSGLRPATGGSAYDDGVAARGWYVRPTVYVDVPPEHPLAREEVFGPVLVTTPFTSESGAVASANDTDYGLAAAVWSGDLTRGLRVAEQIDAGQVAVNGGALTVETPFGGYKQSGYGREKGIEALDDYAQVKSISVSLG